MNIQELFNKGRKYLKENKIEDYNILAKELLIFVLGVDKTYLVTNSLNLVEKNLEQKYWVFLKKVVQGLPMQYITNKQEFMKMEFFVNENVLIPQPDTEILVEEVLKENSNNKEIKILDLCTGSGAIAVSLAKNLDSTVEISAADISKKALNIANRNAVLNGVNNIEFIKTDMFDKINKKYDIIVSNPPYIETNMIASLSKQVQNEPYIALDGGVDGLRFYRILIEESKKYLKNGGKIYVEIGYNQKEKIIGLLSVSPQIKEYKTVKDLSNNDRVIMWQYI